MHTEADTAFLESIIASPENDTPRLIYSDYLEESGHPVRVAYAEFIRVQIEIARLGPTAANCSGLQEREATLLKANCRDWNGPVHRRMSTGASWYTVGSRRGLVQSWRYRRGFIADVTVHGSVVARYAKDIRKLGPLECLRMSNHRDLFVSPFPTLLLRSVREMCFYHLTDDAVPLLLSWLPRGQLRLLDLRRHRFTERGRLLIASAIRIGQLSRQTILD